MRSTTDPSTCRLTVVAEQNPGLLGAVAATVAAEGLLVTKAAVSTWPAGRITVIGTRLVRPGAPIGGANWERIGARIKTAILDGALPEVDFEPRPPVTVDVIRPDGEEHPEGLVVVVRAPHRVGLLWATCSWFATHGCLVEVAHIEAAGNIRQSIYVVRGEVDARVLRAHLSAGADRAAVTGWPGRWLGRLLGRRGGQGFRGAPGELARTASR